MVFTATIFAMATGIVGAAVTVLGIMAAPIMMKCHYSPRLSAGRHRRRRHAGHPDPPQRHAGGHGAGDERLGGQAYAAAFGPGFLLAGLYIAYLLVRCYLNPELGPPVPLEERLSSSRR